PTPVFPLKMEASISLVEVFPTDPVTAMTGIENLFLQADARFRNAWSVLGTSKIWTEERDLSDRA
ncbi:hypothetical protein, partial [Xanthomonas translucens]